uniref:G-protein coupled receptors family 1 profile domain-containing protein n=1 Tax=Panagrolaimus superbus TaxID=310955 RepID=A0A914Y6Y9_9BILA
MCDIYSASDVACSTASILLLAVISFDRYRAVSRPIQYSRQSQNIQRVVFILIAIWLISILLASPIVFGINYRPPDANPYECRFYNPEFSIMSSFVSFVIPCFIVLFVYIRIMMALRKREKAAKARRNANSHSDG